MPGLSTAKLLSAITAAAVIVLCTFMPGAVRADSSGLAPDVAASLGKMQKTLSAGQFSFQARTIRAYTGPNGELLHVEHLIKGTG